MSSVWTIAAAIGKFAVSRITPRRYSDFDGAFVDDLGWSGTRLSTHTLGGAGRGSVNSLGVPMAVAADHDPEPSRRPVTSPSISATSWLFTGQWRVNGPSGTELPA